MITLEKNVEVTRKGQEEISEVIEMFFFFLDLHSSELIEEHTEDLSISLCVNYASIKKKSRCEKCIFFWVLLILIINLCWTGTAVKVARSESPKWLVPQSPSASVLQSAPFGSNLLQVSFGLKKRERKRRGRERREIELILLIALKNGCNIGHSSWWHFICKDIKSLIIHLFSPIKHL